MKIFARLPGCGLQMVRYCAAILSLGSVPCLGSALFSDGTFGLVNYTQTTYTNNTAAAGAAYSVTQSAGSGNPAPALDFHVDWTVNTTFTIFDGLINSGFTYNPAIGAISSIGFSLDRNVTFTPGTVVFTNAGAVALLEQAGNFYLNSITGPPFVADSWQTISATGLLAADFSLYDFTSNTTDSSQHPDFSNSGGVISFGFRTGLGHSNSLGTGSFDALSDNLSITVSTVPEPSATLLAITCGLGLAVRRWCVSRKPKPATTPGLTGRALTP